MDFQLHPLSFGGVPKDQKALPAAASWARTLPAETSAMGSYRFCGYLYIIFLRFTLRSLIDTQTWPFAVAWKRYSSIHLFHSLG